MTLKNFFFLVCAGMYSLLSATPAIDALQETFGESFNFVTEPFVSNLLKFTATPGPTTDPTLTGQIGYVDVSGHYVAQANTVVTDRSYILELKNTAEQLPSEFNVYNLIAYVGYTKFSPFEQLIFIDSSDAYALIGGAMMPDFNDFFQVNFYIEDMFIPEAQAEFLYSQRHTLGSFLEGSVDAPKTLFVIGEPNCPICNELYEGTRSYVEAGELSIHWSLVFFINETSQGKAWAILEGVVPDPAYPSTPAGAFAYNEDHFGPGDNGGIPPVDTPTFDAKVSLNRNEQFFDLYTSLGTPFIVYKDINGNPQYSGLPDDIPAFIDNVCSCPRQ